LIALPLVTIACWLAVSSSAAVSPAATLDDLVKRPIPLRSGIGSAHDEVSTSSKDAQAWYDQGLAYLHSYVWLEAARSFNQALRIDPALAMAQIGLTYAYIELNAPTAARAALQAARGLEAGAGDHDRAHIAARAVQMDAESSARDRVPGRLAEYRAALDGALARFPRDEELWLLRGHAESSDPAERGQGSGAAAIRFYEKARALAPAHAAAHHYLTHAYENSGRIDEARAEGAFYASAAPDVPHARHMHGHDLRRAGRMGEAIEEFRAADALHTAWARAERIPPESDWDYQHNLDLLATSYQYLGQMRSAETLLKTSFAIASPLVQQELNKREWPVFLRARGRAAEALAAANMMAAHRSPLVSAAGHVEAGRALLLLGKFQAAADEANAALRLMREAPEGAGLVAKPLEELHGEFQLRTGQREKGRAMLQDVVRKARLSPGPDAWTATTFAIEAVGRAARETDDWELAAWAAKQMIEHDAGYAGAHLARALAAEHEGDLRTARAEFERVRELWTKADPDLPELQRVVQALRPPRSAGQSSPLGAAREPPLPISGHRYRGWRT
jgi:tetratricopeptide (TPR) repeat protein